MIKFQCNKCMPLFLVVFFDFDCPNVLFQCICLAASKNASNVIVVSECHIFGYVICFTTAFHDIMDIPFLGARVITFTAMFYLFSMSGLHTVLLYIFLSSCSLSRDGYFHLTTFCVGMREYVCCILVFFFTAYLFLWGSFSVFWLCVYGTSSCPPILCACKCLSFMSAL